MKYILLSLSLLLTSCTSIPGVPDSLQGKNVVKTAATTAVTYAVAGPIPAALNLATSIGVDEVIEEDTSCRVEPGNTQQMWSCLFEETKEMIIGGIIAFLAFTTVIAPWAAQRRARRRRKYEQYKAEAKLARRQNAERNENI